MRIAFIIWFVFSYSYIQSQYISEWHTLRGDGGIWLSAIKKSSINTILWFEASGDTSKWDDNMGWNRSSYSAGSTNAYFIAIDSLQNTAIYNQFYSKVDNNVFCYEIELLDDGGYILTFLANDSLWMNDALIFVDDSLQLNRGTFHVMKLKSDGSVAFHTKFQGGGINDAYLGLLPDGKIVVAGTVDYRDITIGDYELHCLGCHVEDSDIIVALLDSAGIVLNAKRFGGFGYDYCEDLLCSADGNIYITGSFDSDDFYVDSLFLDNALGWLSTDAYIAKLDGNLQPQWIKQAHSYDFEYGFCLEEDKAGDILWGVHFGGSKVYFDGDTLAGGVSNSFLSKMDSDGAVDWVKTFTSNYYNRFLDVSVDEDNNLWLSAWYRDTLTFEGGSIIGRGKQDDALIQLDGAGNYLQSFNLTEPGSEIVYQVEPLSGNRLFIVGNADSLYFLNMNIEPQESFGDPNFCFILQLPPVATHESPDMQHLLEISLFPVPASDRLNILINAEEDIANASLIVYDAFSRLQLQRNLAIRKESNSAILEISALTPGLYFLEIQDNEGRSLGGVRFNKL